MALTVDQFVNKYNGKYVDTDNFPKNQPYQCWDLVNRYCLDVIKMGWLPTGGDNAQGVYRKFLNPLPKFFDRIPNNVITRRTKKPSKGDIIVWGNELGGHIAIVLSANATSFTSFDQNWPIGSKPHKQGHNYKQVLGWLKIKKDSMLDRKDIFIYSYRTLFGKSPNGGEIYTFMKKSKLKGPQYVRARWLKKLFVKKSVYDAKEEQWGKQITDRGIELGQRASEVLTLKAALENCKQPKTIIKVVETPILINVFNKLVTWWNERR